MGFFFIRSRAANSVVPQGWQNIDRSGFPGMGNTLKIWKIGKYWEIRTLIKKIYYIIFVFYFKKNIFNLYRFYYVNPLRFAIK